MEYVDGEDPDLAIEAGRGGQVLFRLGQFLHQLHQVEISGLSDVLAGAGGVLVHGDFVHHNALIGRNGSELIGVLDSESAAIRFSCFLTWASPRPWPPQVQGSAA